MKALSASSRKSCARCARLAALLVFIHVFGFPAASAAQNAQFQDGRLFLPGGAPIDMSHFVKRAADADYVLIGEKHDSPHHHQMQAKLLESLAKAGLRPGVGFEMLYSRDQKKLEKFNAREISVAELESDSDWKNSWSYPFAIYAPIFQVAERFDLPVYGLNISKATLDKVRTAGFASARAMPEREVPDLPPDVIWPLPAQIAYLDKVRANRATSRPGMPVANETAPADPGVKDLAHGYGPMKAGNPKRFQLIQSLWDTCMAQSAIKAHEETGRPIVVIAGGGHVENGYGIAHRIRTLTPGKKIFLVMPLSSPLIKGDPRADKADVFFASRPTILALGAVFRANADRIIVDEITRGSRAEAAGMKKGDRVVSLAGTELKSPDDFHAAIATADMLDKRKGLTEKSEKKLVVQRGETRRSLILR